jgi:hypothetical protein
VVAPHRAGTGLEPQRIQLVFNIDTFDLICSQT